MPASSNGDAERLDPVIVEALKQLRSLTYRRRRLISAASPRVMTSRLSQAAEVVWLLAHARIENRKKSLSDPAARSGAIHIFKHLKHHGYAWNPEHVHAWAITHGFTAQDAQRLAEYAEGVQAGTRYHTQPDPFGRHAIVYWRQQGAERQP
jgi:hypothetical protein